MKYLMCMAVFFGSPLLAGVGVDSSINDVYYRGEHELMGNLTMVVEGNDFAGASAENPVFIEVRLLGDAVLADTLVDPVGGDVILAQPIYLALSPASASDLRVIAPAESVSIVEWIAGRNTYWIKVQTGSSQWLADGTGKAFSPNAVDSVSWSIGLSARQSAQRQREGGNLPFNTRNPLAQAASDAVSTLHCANLEGSALGISGLESLASFELGAYGPQAEFAHNQFVAAQPLDIEFTGDLFFARGKNRTVWTQARTDLEKSTMRAESEGWLVAEGVLDLELTAVQVAEYLSTGLLDGAKITLRSEGNYGFSADGAAFWEPCGARGVASVITDSAFEYLDRTLYREIEVVWDGGEHELNGYKLSLQVRLEIPEGLMAASPRLIWTLALPNIDSSFDLPPFDGPHQQRRCRPSFWKTEGFWQPAGDPEQDRILAHITRAQGVFTTALVLINPEAERSGYLITGYDMAGNSLGTWAGVLDSKARLALSTSDLFGVESASHLSSAATSPVRLRAAYRALGPGRATAHVFDSGDRATSWRLDPGEKGSTADGLALINLGEVPCDVRLLELNAVDQILEETVLYEGLPPMAKLLHVFQPKHPRSHFVVTADTETAVTALRTSLDATYLWQGPALPLRP